MTLDLCCIVLVINTDMRKTFTDCCCCFQVMASDIKIIEQLYKAVQDGCKERVHDILQSNHDVVYEILNHTGPERGYYYLHEACKRGHEEVVTLLTSYYEHLDQSSPQVRADRWGK